MGEDFDSGGFDSGGFDSGDFDSGSIEIDDFDTGDIGGIETTDYSVEDYMDSEPVDAIEFEDSFETTETYEDVSELSDLMDESSYEYETDIQDVSDEVAADTFETDSEYETETVSDYMTEETVEDVTADVTEETVEDVTVDVTEETVEDVMVDVTEETMEVPVETTEEATAYDSMYEYMADHNYGREDYETYSKDPEWQALNNDLLEEMGRDPIDYGEAESGSAYDSMYDYMVEHNYGREDYETYSKDPAWQELNNDLLQEMGRDPIEYEETQELSDLMDETADEIPVEIAEEPVVEEPVVEEATEVVEEPVVEEPTEVVEEPVVEEATEPNVETTEESSAYDNMYDYMVEHNYGREDYETYSKDPEWQALNNDLLEEMGREPIEYQDIVYDVEHNYEFNDVLLSENPEFNGMFESGEFYQQGLNEYGFNGTCGETTQANTFNHMLGTNEFTENDVLNIALEKDLCFNDPSDLNSCGGTSTEQFMQLYEEMNHRTGDQLNVELFDYDQALSINEMADRLDQGGMLNIAVDSKELWDEPRDMTPHNTDHWISVVGVDRDLSGNVQGFKIIDSGGGENYLDIDHFERCYYGPEDNPVLDPTCIVVSKKGK